MDDLAQAPVMTAFGLVVGLVPVVLFLAALILMDSYQLVPRRAVARTLIVGCAAAVAALAANRLAVEALRVDPLILKRYVAPVIEEVLKAAYVAWLIRAARVGFLVDAGIQGFAVGTGFALVENVYYAGMLGDFQPLLWIVRGLGTAVMHGSTTAMVAISAKDLTDRHSSRALLWLAPGLLLAIAIHSFFNHLVLNPLLTTSLLLLVMPLVLFVVFVHSERATRDWLGRGMDRDIELIELILGSEVHESRVGRYLESLKARFPAHVVGDMLCYLRIYLELSVRAKGLLIARSVGVQLPADDRVRANFQEMRFLEKSIGTTGRMAMLPFMQLSSRDLWQLHMLGRE